MSIHVSHFNFHGRFSQLPNLTLACYLLFNQLVSKNELSKGIWLSIYPVIRRESNQWNARGEWARNFRGGVGGTHGRSLARVVKIGGFATQTAGRRAASSAAGLRVVARCPDVPGEISEIGWHLLQKANMFIVEFEEWVLINYCCFHLFSKMGNQKWIISRWDSQNDELHDTFLNGGYSRIEGCSGSACCCWFVDVPPSNTHVSKEKEMIENEMTSAKTISFQSNQVLFHWGKVLVGKLVN